MKHFPLMAIMVAMLSPAAADWPTCRGDAARTGYTPEPLPETLSLQWTYKARHAPRPAWPRESRMRFDRGFQPVANADTLFFGSSADGKLHSLDVATGQERWTFFTDAPIRFAPVLWRDRVFVASDDGVLYFGAGIWTAEGIYLHAPDPETSEKRQTYRMPGGSWGSSHARTAFSMEPVPTRPTSPATCTANRRWIPC